AAAPAGHRAWGSRAAFAFARRAGGGGRAVRAPLPELVPLCLRRQPPRGFPLPLRERACALLGARQPHPSRQAGAGMRAIIVAAGMGRRLTPYTDDRPKCLVEVNGRSILDRQVEAYRMAGVDELVIVRGYQKERIQVEGARYFDNDQFRENNI